MHIEMTVTVGNILTMVVMVITVLGAAWRISLQVKKIEWRMNMIWNWYKKEHNIDEPDE